MTRIVLYTTQYCGYCRAAKQLLSAKGYTFTEIDVGESPGLREEMVQLAGGLRTVPQIFIDGTHVGGYEELAALDRAAKLEPWLARVPEVRAAEALLSEAPEPETGDACA
jgi:glutaredoxin 3